MEFFFWNINFTVVTVPLLAWHLYSGVSGVRNVIQLTLSQTLGCPQMSFQ